MKILSNQRLDSVSFGLVRLMCFMKWPIQRQKRKQDKCYKCFVSPYEIHLTYPDKSTFKQWKHNVAKYENLLASCYFHIHFTYTCTTIQYSITYDIWFVLDLLTYIFKFLFISHLIFLFISYSFNYCFFAQKTITKEFWIRGIECSHELWIGTLTFTQCYSHELWRIRNTCKISTIGKVSNIGTRCLLFKHQYKVLVAF